MRVPKELVPLRIEYTVVQGEEEGRQGDRADAEQREMGGEACLDGAAPGEEAGDRQGDGPTRQVHPRNR